MTASVIPKSPVVLAAAARTAQNAVRAQLMRDAVKLWPLLNQNDLAGSFNGWLAAMIALITRYYGQSSMVAGLHYRRARATATMSPAPAELIKTAPPPAIEWIRQALGFAGPGMLNRDTAKPGTALSTVLGTSARIALSGGRNTILDTVKADPVAVGWYRVTDGSPCAFCALLASRGVAYKSEKTAEFQSHNDCGCTAAPAFSRSEELPALSETALQVYLERGSGPALQAFRKAWADRQSA